MMNTRTIQLVTAAVAAVFVLIAAVLSATSAGTWVLECPGTPNPQNPQRPCAASERIWKWRDHPWDIKMWSALDTHNQVRPNAGWRYFIFAIELLVVLIAVGLLVWRIVKHARDRIRMAEVVLAVLASVLCIVVGSLEIWFGCSKALQVITADAWVAAAVFLFLAAIVFAVDATLSLVKRDD